jgi:hypothetical protein
LIGEPVHFGEFRWKAYCPQTKALASVLYLDNSTNLFVSRAAIGKPAPRSIIRGCEDIIILTALEHLPSRKNLPERQDSAARGKFSLGARLSNARTEIGVEKIEQDLLFSSNGLPFVKWKSTEEIDVLGTIDSRDCFEQWPFDFVELCENFLREPHPPRRSPKGLK